MLSRGGNTTFRDFLPYREVIEQFFKALRILNSGKIHPALFRFDKFDSLGQKQRAPHAYNKQHQQEKKGDEYRERNHRTPRR